LSRLNHARLNRTEMKLMLTSLYLSLLSHREDKVFQRKILLTHTPEYPLTSTEKLHDYLNDVQSVLRQYSSMGGSTKVKFWSSSHLLKDDEPS
jgi:hypothetical protein